MRQLLAGAMLSVFLVACSGTAPSASTPASAPSISAAPSSAPAASAIAVKPGEPWIVYAWPRVATDGVWAIYLMRPDGTDSHEIVADVPGEHRAPAWSSDGAKLAFVVRDEAHPEGSIWTADADGSRAALLSGGGSECPVGLFHPAWSPDGKRLAVVCYPGGDDHESVAVLDVATGSLRRVADFTHPDAVDSAPTWSHDGHTIAFEIRRYDATGDALEGAVVATVPADGGEIHRLTSPEQFMVHPTWSPDGAELVMNELRAAAQPANLYAISPDGTGLHQLTHASTDGHMRIETPRWDPDGTRLLVSIVYSSGPAFEFGGEVRMGFVDAAGGEPKIIEEPAGKYPDLRPTP